MSTAPENTPTTPVPARPPVVGPPTKHQLALMIWDRRLPDAHRSQPQRRASGGGSAASSAPPLTAQPDAAHHLAATWLPRLEEAAGAARVADLRQST